MVDIKKILDSTSSFIIDPSNKSRAPSTQGLAWATTILVGIGTAGVVHVLSAIWRKLRHIDNNDTHDKMSQIFNNIFSKSNTTSVAPISPTVRTATSQNDNFPLVPAQTPSASSAGVTSASNESARSAAQDVYDQRDSLWEEAVTKAGQDKYKVMNIFTERIESKLAEHDVSLSDISNNPEALDILFNSDYLRTALVLLAKKEGLNNLLDKHFVFVAKRVYENRDALARQAQQEARQAGKSHLEQLVCFTNLIRKEFAREGRSLQEIMNNTDALEVFSKSSRLVLALALYVRVNQGSSPKNPEAIKAQGLAQQHAPNRGLVTKLDLQDMRSDEALLKKGIRRFLLKNHPDKNPDADPALVQAAGQLLDLIKGGVYKNYADALKEYRGRGQ